MTVSTIGDIATTNGSRYLQQLCKHWSHKLTVDFTPERGNVAFPNGTVATMQAGAERLEVQIEAPDADTLELMKGVVMEHLDRFAFREAPLSAEWRSQI